MCSGFCVAVDDRNSVDLRSRLAVGLPVMRARVNWVSGSVVLFCVAK